MSTRKIILNQFEPNFAIPLIEFGKSLSKIDADFLIFMARKALCLYDVLLYIGIPPIEKCVLSDRVLDMCLDPFKGKKIALIDDTLILGTTLYKTKKTLESIANEVSVHVFCTDNDWWSKDLIMPDSNVLELNDDRLLNFCTAEIRALSLLPRPYIVDFPLTSNFFIKESNFHLLLSCVEWVGQRISSQLQMKNGVEIYTFFPTEDILSELKVSFGEPIYSCFDITKIRLFARKSTDGYFIQLVPMITLKPLTYKHAEGLFFTFINKLNNISDISVDNIVHYFNSPVSCFRGIQYLLSSFLGTRFIDSLTSTMGQQIKIEYDGAEIDRHFGPWLHDEMIGACKNAYSAFSLSSSNGADFIEVNHAKLPYEIRKYTKEKFRTCRSVYGNIFKGRKKRQGKEVLFFPSITEVFLHLFDTEELPAREEVKRLGIRAVDGPPESAPHRNRLNIGIPWVSIIDYLGKLYDIVITKDIENLLSLTLDTCNDLGIAVPVTCCQKGIVYRGYRHGEDVHFTDDELGLAYEAIQGLLKSTNRNNVPKLVLEKLLVLLIKIGAAKDFLEPLYGTSGSDGTAKIGFYLMGAVPILYRGPTDFADREIWLTKYLLKRNVIKLDQSGMYVLGEKKKGNYKTPDAPSRSYELGRILGILLRSSKDSSRQNAPLSTEALTTLATCSRPIHAAAAIQIELDLFREWYEDNGRSILLSTDWSNPQMIWERRKYLIQSLGYTSINQANLKFVAYKNNHTKGIVEACERYLEDNPSTDILARTWSSYWIDIKSQKEVGEKKKFDPLIDKGGVLFWDIGLCLLLIDLSLSCRSYLLSKNKSYPQKIEYVFKKVNSFNKRMLSTQINQSSFSASLIRRFNEIEQSRNYNFDHQSAFNYAISYIDEKITDISNLVDSMDSVKEVYGRIYYRQDYKYILYYDIYDSTAEKANLKGKDLIIYRDKVRKFKKTLNMGFYRISKEARSKRSQIFCYNGNLTSSNDCKNVFFGGSYTKVYLEKTFKMLIEMSSSFHDIQLRIYILPCAFAGTKAYRYEGDTEVTGERFWEHFSRLLKASSKFEEEYIKESSFVLIATEDLFNSFKIPDEATWINLNRSTVISEIEGLGRKTDVFYGGIKI